MVWQRATNTYAVDLEASAGCMGKIGELSQSWWFLTLNNFGGDALSKN